MSEISPREQPEEKKEEPIPEPEQAEKEKMVEVIKISTVFSDSKILESVADKLLSKGVISGFHIDRVLSGYVAKGKKVKEEQYSLDILLDPNASEEVKTSIRTEIEGTIGKKWEVPVIEEENILINEKFLGFIKRAEVEHRKYKNEKNLRLTLAVTLLLSIAGLIGTYTKKHFDSEKNKAVTAERKEGLRKLYGLEMEVQKQISALNAQLEAGKPLHYLPNDMAAVESYEETNEIMETVRKFEFETQKLIESEEK